MWKIFRCKRGEERFLMPGESSIDGLILPRKEDLKIVIDEIRNSLSPCYTRILEDTEWFVVQNWRDRRFLSFCYKTFLEILKIPLVFKSGVAFPIKTYKCEPTEEVVKVFDALERYLY